MIKTFRGLLADGAQQRIRLSTNQGLIGYQIKKFELMPNEPGEDQHESTVKVYSVEQSSVDNTVNFDSPTLLAVAIWQSGNAPGGSDALWVPLATIFDNKVINQDIFVTHSETDGSNPINYYLELEQVKLDINEATVATLKDMRGRE
jgi:hypothetical protein